MKKKRKKKTIKKKNRQSEKKTIKKKNLKYDTEEYNKMLKILYWYQKLKNVKMNLNYQRKIFSFISLIQISK